MIRVILSDDHALFRLGAREVLQAHGQIDVVAEAATAAETLAVVKSTTADVLIVDLTMPGAIGTSLIRKLATQSPGIPIIVISAHDDAATVQKAFNDGATAYVSKKSQAEHLLSAVLQASAGKSFVDPSIPQFISEGDRPTKKPHQSLSNREWQILMSILDGQMLSQIAEALQLSPKTITTHKTNIMAKLGVANNAELIRYAVENGLVRPTLAE